MNVFQTRTASPSTLLSIYRTFEENFLKKNKFPMSPNHAPHPHTLLSPPIGYLKIFFLKKNTLNAFQTCSVSLFTLLSLFIGQKKIEKHISKHKIQKFCISLHPALSVCWTFEEIFLKTKYIFLECFSNMFCISLHFALCLLDKK